jgi:hypothetical protein
MFKHRYWDHAIKFWKLSRGVLKDDFDISIMFNMAIVYILDLKFDQSLDTCQDLIREICIHMTSPD